MATKKTKSTKSIKSAPVLRDAEPYKNSAGVKLPNADLIIEADASGAVTSCRDAVTGTEYVGGGGGGGSVDVVFGADSYPSISGGKVIYIDVAGQAQTLTEIPIDTPIAMQSKSPFVVHSPVMFLNAGTWDFAHITGLSRVTFSSITSGQALASYVLVCQVD